MRSTSLTYNAAINRLDTLLAVKEQWRLKNGRKSDLKNVILFEVFVALFALNDSGEANRPTVTRPALIRPREQTSRAR